MTISLKHAFTSAVADGGDANLVQPSNWNAEHTLTLAADRVLGRLSSPGAAEELTGVQILTLAGGAASSHTHVEGDITLGNTQRIVGRNSGGGGAAEEVTATQALDWIGSTQGELLYRSGSAWSALAVGTSGQSLRTAGASANPAWADIYGMPQAPYWGDSDQFLGPPYVSQGTSQALTASVLYMMPIVVPERRTFTTIKFYINTLQGTSGIRVGLWSAVQATRQPNALLQEATGSPVDASTGTGSTGGKTVTISQALDPGLYFIGLLTDGTPAVNGFSTSAAAFGFLGLDGSGGANFGTSIRGLQRTSVTYQALSNYADESAQTYAATGNNFPLMGMR